jgi:photosystem II stability/assembly factor-like uncharacterized protein
VQCNCKKLQLVAYPNPLKMKTTKPILLIGNTILLLLFSIYSNAQEIWLPTGPFNNSYNNKFALQATISQIDLSKTDPNLILAGTHAGEIYKSTDGGNNWINISLKLPNKRPIKVLKIHPGDNKKIFAGTQSRIFLSQDNGNSWQVLFELDNTNPRAIQINPNTNSAVFTSEKGTYRSINSYTNWTKIDPDPGFDLISIPNEPEILFLLKHEPSSDQLNLTNSIDDGLSFSGPQLIWDQNPISDFQSGKLTLSAADQNKVFIYLSGNQNPTDNNNLGLWVYERDSETLTKTYGGGPYDTNHPNLLTSNAQSSFVKGFDYINIIANPQNANELLFGAINMFSSEDQGLTFTATNSISQHAPPGYYMNVRDLACLDGTCYIATDAGLYKSTNFFKDDNYELITGQIQSANCYDFAHDWHSRSFVSSAEHIGSFASTPDYPDNQTVYLGGIENTFTALNLYNGQIMFSNELNALTIPSTTDNTAVINSNQFKVSANSNKLPVKNTNLSYHPNRYNIVFTGQSNQLLRSANGGFNFGVLYNFDSQFNITGIEIDRNNPALMYLCLQHKANSSNDKKLMKSTNGGQSWSAVTLPTDLNDKHLMISLDANIEGSVYICSKSPSNSSRIYHSTNGGQSWQPISMNGLPKHFFHDMIYMSGYNNGLIICTEKSVYRLKENSGWEAFNNGLPEQINISKAAFYYKEGILQISSYGKGLWSLKLEETQNQPKACISVDRIFARVNCIDDATFRFFDYSMVNKEQYSIQWDFEDGTISGSIGDYKRNVIFNSPGIKTVTLSVLDQNNNPVDTDSMEIEIQLKDVDNEVNIDFENTSENTGLDDIYYHYVPGRIHQGIGGFGNSPSCFWLNNKTINTNRRALIPIATDLSGMSNPHLEFDIAYSQFACIEDFLNVYSKDCTSSDFTINASYGTEELKTTESQEFNFQPNPSQWKRVRIPLNNIALAERAFIYIEHVTPTGNNVFIDNITIKNL